ncbi:MAG: penicillin-binding protein 1C [Deltaproteobacteria bacterium]|nr:penicillin-binding protein 1C [Deltaproteobacteria bacterium]
MRAIAPRIAARGREAVRRAKPLLVVLAVAWVAWRVFRVSVGSPIEALHDDSWTEGTRVLARDGRLLGERASAEGLRGRRSKLEDVSPRLVAATLASEDRRFRTHDGVDRLAVVRATATFVRRGHVVSGASTITAQLVKRLDHQGKPRPKTVAQKLRELARAQNLEAQVGKDEILEAYLDHIDYGHGWAGPDAAAMGYFGVRARDVSLAQAALLAVLPRAPSALDPYRHTDRAVRRQRALLASMREHGEASAEDVERALSEPIVLRDRSTPSPLLAAHVVIASDGARRAKAKTEHDVHTTLDLDLQRDVEALVRSHAARLSARGAANAAVVVVDNATGEVLAEVGNVDFADASIAGAVDLVRAKRQPGSTLKPFVYARSFERGVSPMEMLADVPTEYGGGVTEGARGGAVVWSPENFDGTFVGPVSAREALGGSLNVPAVRLAAELGAHEVVSTLRRTGLSLVDGEKRYGLSIALGSGEVTPLELAEAYATLARGGEHLPVRDRLPAKGEARKGAERVLEASAVAAVAEALADPVARVRGLRTRGPFDFGYPVSVKTGTSTAFRDAWTAGFTRERTVVVWVGNATGSATSKLTGAVGAGPLFFDAMSRAMRDVKERRPLFDADLMEEVEVCPLSGHRPGLACTDHVRRWFPRGHAPTHTCTVHQLASPRPTSGAGEPSLRCDPEGAQRIVVLPQAYKGWLADRPLGAPGADARGTPWFLGAQVPGCAPPSGDEPRIVVLAPRDGSVVLAEGDHHDAVDVAVETRGLPPAEPLEVVVDGRLATRMEIPYRTRVAVERGDHLFEIRPADGRRGAILGRAQISVR